MFKLQKMMQFNQLIGTKLNFCHDRLLKYYKIANIEAVGKGNCIFKKCKEREDKEQFLLCNLMKHAQ